MASTPILNQLQPQLTTSLYSKKLSFEEIYLSYRDTGKTCAKGAQNSRHTQVLFLADRKE